MKPSYAAFVIALVIASAGCQQQSSSTEIRHVTAIQHGSELYKEAKASSSPTNSYSCASCHDVHAGDSAVRKVGAPLAGVTSRPSYWGGSELDLLRSINDCLFYFMQQTQPWKADEEAAVSMYAWLESLPSSDQEKQAAPFTVIANIVDLPAGDSTHGAGVYAETCAQCHGAAHTGSGRKIRAALVLPEQFLSEHPDPTYTAQQRRDITIEKARHGGFLDYGGYMPPFSAEILSDADLADIVEFLGPY